MDKKILRIIEQFGLEEKQAKVYVAALEVGNGSVLDIARQAGVQRVTTYYTLGQLSGKGLISLSKKGKSNSFVALSPKSLISRAESTLNQLKEILPELLAIENSSDKKPVIRFFEGKAGMAAILDDMIQTLKKIPKEQREVLEYASPESAFEAIEDEQKDFIQKRIKHGIKLRWIAPQTQLAVAFQEKAKEGLREMRVVDPSRFSLKTEMNIYGSKINLIGEKGQEIGVIIEHPEITQTQREIFELAWLGAESLRLSSK